MVISQSKTRGRKRDLPTDDGQSWPLRLRAGHTGVDEFFPVIVEYANGANSHDVCHVHGRLPVKGVHLAVFAPGFF